MSKKTQTRKVYFVIAAIAVAGVLVDQLTKFWALKNLPYGENVQVLGKALQWILVKNPGAAFSFLESATWAFTLVSAGVVVFVIIYSRKIVHLKWATVAGLVLAGALGNLIDRIFREPGFAVGHVVDFIFTPWIVPAVYNVADIAIVSGMGLLLLFTIFSDKKTLEEKPQREQETS